MESPQGLSGKIYPRVVLRILTTYSQENLKPPKGFSEGKPETATEARPIVNFSRQPLQTFNYLDHMLQAHSTQILQFNRLPPPLNCNKL